MQVFDFETKSGLFQELDDLRMIHREYEPARLVRLGDEFYFTGYEAGVMKLSLKL